MADSTNVGRPGTHAVRDEVGRALGDRFRRAPGRIIVATFASHIHRIQQVLDLAATFGRKVALLGRSMETNVRRGRGAGLPPRARRDAPVPRGAGGAAARTAR